MTAMIDTMVLAYAFQAEGRNPVSKRQQKEHSAGLDGMAAHHAASRLVLSRLATVRISAITVVEFRRGMRENEIAWFDNKLSGFEVLDISGPVATKASELLRLRVNGKGESSCYKCLGTKEEAVCGKCGLRVSSQRKLNDAIVVATAELSDKVQVLYSFDGGVHAFQKHLKQCLIRNPLEMLAASERKAVEKPPEQAKQGTEPATGKRGNLMLVDKEGNPILPG
ncbi:hypothetical protein WME77_29450 [Sorangium sp. So ce764]|uniref:hypothetical protein n=1 Tax=Sorangium sp. So ce764 TaxID=3133320 RepID=UPI003F639B2B